MRHKAEGVAYRDLPLERLVPLLMEEPKVRELFCQHPQGRAHLHHLVQQTIASGFAAQDSALYSAHRTLQYLLELSLQSPSQVLALSQDLPTLLELQHALLAAWQRDMDFRIAQHCRRAAERIPVESRAFVTWVLAQVKQHATAIAPFCRYLAQEASAEQLRHFCCQERAVYAQMETLLRLVQSTLDTSPWMAVLPHVCEGLRRAALDEVYTCLGDVLFAQGEARRCVFSPPTGLTAMPWQTSACRNTLLLPTLDQHYGPMAVGLYTALALQAPLLWRWVRRGLKRLGLFPPLRTGLLEQRRAQYGHSGLWPLLISTMESAPGNRYAIATGTFYRLFTSLDYSRRLYALYTGKPMLTSEPGADPHR